jgi:hypothetical protein
MKTNFLPEQIADKDILVMKGGIITELLLSIKRK